MNSVNLCEREICRDYMLFKMHPLCRADREEFVCKRDAKKFLHSLSVGVRKAQRITRKQKYRTHAFVCACKILYRYRRRRREDMI